MLYMYQYVKFTQLPSEQQILNETRKQVWMFINFEMQMLQYV